MKSKTKSRELILQDSTVVFSNSHESLIQARLLHFSHHLVIFETQSPDVIVQTSEVLLDFRIQVNSRPIYSGRAIVTSSVTTGPTTICQASLEDAWLDLEAFKLVLKPKQLRAGFDGFINSWQKVYQILPEYKIVIADIQTFLSDLRLWLEQVELGIRSSPAEDQAKLEEEIAHDLRGPVGSALGNMFERFEAICANIEEDMHPAHRAFGQRQLHSLLLCAPFIHRTYAKPLGYAGDYEMMNMIVRNGLEGNSLYAKLVNGYLLDQVGPQSVRNRVDYLNNRIVDETSRMTALGKIAKIYCIACGPAWEVRNFIAESPLANHAQFELLDFNEETLQHTQSKIDDVKKLHQRRTPVKFVRSSVQNLLVGKSKPMEQAGYDLIYCSGLYDYLNDRIIKALNSYLYDKLTPGGLLVVGNFAPCTPVRNFIEHFLEWFLIYRDGRQLSALAPNQVGPADCKVVSEPTGANIFLEVRKSP